MCRMLCKISEHPSGIMQEMERCPNSLLWLSENGIKSHDPNVRGLHNDGCGMAYIDQKGEIKNIRKGKSDFWNKDYHDFAAQANSRLYIAHNRFASKGLNTIENGSHPFLMSRFNKDYAFCHNGVVDSFMEEAKQRNTSDSEIFMEHIINGMNSEGEKEVILSIEKIAQNNEYASLCGFLLSNNEVYIWRLFDENKKEDYDKLSRYYTLYLSIRSNYVLVASEPLDDENWMLIPNKQFLTIKPLNDGIDIRSFKLKTD
jgi:predicted glutamine amidotransferase